MTMSFRQILRSVIALILFTAASLAAGNLDITGVTLLRQFDPTLQGSGVKEYQVKAVENGTNTPSAFEVNPSASGVGQPVSLFKYLSFAVQITGYPNVAGVESGHANGVAVNFYGTNWGVVPQINHVDNYEANYFYSSIIGSMAAIQCRIVNQSFIFDQSTLVERHYDDYAARYNTIFISGAGFNGGPVYPAATSFNGIGVGVSDVVNPPFGPTADGRCKPDLVAPGSAASFATPYVSGSSVILVQAAARGDGGTNISTATNLLTIKALLLNGAIKPEGWTNSSTSPLDLRFGAGVVNVFNSWQQLKGGRHKPIETTSVSTGLFLTRPEIISPTNPLSSGGTTIQSPTPHPPTKSTITILTCPDPTHTR